MSEEALKLSEEESQAELDFGEIDIEALKELNREIIIQANKLTGNVTRFLNKKSKGGVTKEEEKEFGENQKDGWKDVREKEKAYSFLLKKAKQKGIKQKDIEADNGDASPDLEKIKQQDSTIGAIVRKMNI